MVILTIHIRRDPFAQSGFRLGSKLKGALRSAVDGISLEGTEVPTVWDTFNDESPVSTIFNQRLV